MSVKRITYTAIFTVLIILGAFIRIPLPYIPFTMQLFFVLLSGVVLGGKLGAFSVIIYICMGLLGIPVFAKGGGIAYVLQPSFGYILGFILASYIVGILINGKYSFIRVLCATLVGTMIIYVIGLGYLYLILNIYMSKVIPIMKILALGLFSTIIGDILSCIIIALIAKRLTKNIRLD